MRKSTLLLLCLAVMAFQCVSLTDSKINSAEASSQSEIAMELSTGKVLTEGNADAKLPMASSTKILTAIIIIEDCNLDEVIIVPDKAVGVEGSSIYLKKGEEIDIRDLLYGLMLRSGNDSAAALAIHHSGSIEKFAETMTMRAKQMGAENSNFKNPSGLPDSEHYTTATNHTGKYRNFANKNKMLRLYEGANGVKTGYTVKAGRCLVSSAKRNGMNIVCVVLNCPDMYERSCEIFDTCFETYKMLNLTQDKTFMCNKVLCKLKDNKNIVIKCSENLNFKVKPVDSDKDGAVAILEIYDENNLLFSEKLYSIIEK